MLTNKSQNIDVPHNAQLFGAQECFKTMVGKEAPSWKHKEHKIRLERKETLEQEQENAQRDAYKEQVFTTHQQVSLLTQRTQVLADKESKQMLSVVSGCKQVIKKHDEAVKKMNDTMHKASTREASRIDAEMQYARALAANGGKDLDYFCVPALETSKRADVRQR